MPRVQHYILRCALPAALAFASSGCCLLVGSETVTVLVAERETGRPVPGAAVRPHYDDCYFGGAAVWGRPLRTDANGRARVSPPGALRYEGFAVEADGYEQYLPPGVDDYTGEAARDGTRVLHVRRVAAAGGHNP